MPLFKRKEVNENDFKSEDFALVKMAADGDKNAFEKIIRKYEKYVCTTVYSVVKNYDDSLDVAQEVFLKLYHNIGSFKGDSSFSSWIYRIAKNTALDFLRHTKNDRKNVSLVTENEDGEETIIDIADTSDSSNPEKTYLNREKKKVMYEALDEISDEHKEIILLRDINGYTYEEISQMLCIESGTVKSRLYRAREALRKKLLEKNYF